MKHKLALVISILALMSPICSTVITLFLESEFVEAILSGLLVGCFVGSVLGGISLLINKGNSRLVKIFSMIPMCPLVLYIMLLIPYLTYKFK